MGTTHPILQQIQDLIDAVKILGDSDEISICAAKAEELSASITNIVATSNVGGDGPQPTKKK
jgi:hypothetical protein